MYQKPFCEYKLHTKALIIFNASRLNQKHGLNHLYIITVGYDVTFPNCLISPSG